MDFSQFALSLLDPAFPVESPAKRTASSARRLGPPVTVASGAYAVENLPSAMRPSPKPNEFALPVFRRVSPLAEGCVAVKGNEHGSSHRR